MVDCPRLHRLLATGLRADVPGPIGRAARPCTQLTPAAEGWGSSRKRTRCSASTGSRRSRWLRARALRQRYSPLTHAVRADRFVGTLAAFEVSVTPRDSLRAQVSETLAARDPGIS